MAKKFVKISLATKLRLLFGAAVLLIIAAALFFPWYFMELLSEQELQRAGEELTLLRLNEWEREHRKNPRATATSNIVALYSAGTEGRNGPFFVKLGPQHQAKRPLDSAARQARKFFESKGRENLAVISTEDQQGRSIFRFFRAVRIKQSCMSCHGRSAEASVSFQPGQPVAIIDASIPGTSARPLVWWTRGSFVIGGTLAALLALIVFAMITQKLIIRPLRHLRNISDKVTEGNLSVRSTIKTGDELQQLGDSFNEMLSAIGEQHEKLRAANRALDLKLDELAEANVTLFEANRVKSDFLANVSHELRTPLNSIIGFAELLCESDDQRITRYGQNITNAAKNLLNVINDLLDLAKIEAGRATVRIDKVSVTDTCQTLLSLMLPLADKKQLDLVGKLEDPLPIVNTDAGKLQQILYNLLSNAIKFTPSGGRVTLSTGTNSFQRSGRNIDEVFVSVADTGSGIAEADQQIIFEKFHQLDPTLTKESGGTGLGLAIARELANLLGGKIVLKSSPGHGAVFTLFLPTDPESKDAALEAENSNGQKT